MCFDKHSIKMRISMRNIKAHSRTLKEEHVTVYWFDLILLWIDMQKLGHIGILISKQLSVFHMNKVVQFQVVSFSWFLKIGAED